MSKEERPTPKIFISYSWSSRQHQQWVIDLAERLVSDGVDVILDKWELREGQDKYAFMERMVTDESVSKVLAICDKQYAEKANKKKGGVGTESQIISKEVYEKVDQKKFVAIVSEYDENGKECVPIFLSSRIFIDMSTEEKTLENYEQLLRFVFDQPLFEKPALGTPPAYIFEDAAVASKTAPKLAMLRRAVLEDRSSVPGLITDYLKSYSASLEQFRIHEQATNEFDEHIIASIDRFLPYRDEFLDFIKLVSIYRDDERTYQLIFEFFQGLIQYLRRPANESTWHELQADNYRFIIHELFLYLITALIKNHRFEQANIFLTQTYYDRYLAERGDGTLVTFTVFDQVPESIDRYRKARLRINLYHVSADLLRKRAHDEELNFEAILQTDFILFLRSALHLTNKYGDYWHPRTIGYAEFHGVFEFFAKAASRSYFQNVMTLLNVTSKEHLDERYKAAVEEGHINRSEVFRHVYVGRLMNLDNLATYQ